MTVDTPQPEIFGSSLVYIQVPAGWKMNDFTEHRDEDRFANGQSCRDLRVRPDRTQPGFQLMEAIDSISDFFRFVRISAREIALNHRGHSKIDASIQEQADAGLEVVNARLNYLAEAIPKPVNYAYDRPPECRAAPENTFCKTSWSVMAATCSASFRSIPTGSGVFMILMRSNRFTVPKSSAWLSGKTGAERVVTFDHVVRNSVLAERGEKGSGRCLSSEGWERNIGWVGAPSSNTKEK
jgi:hypothetical protein